MLIKSKQATLNRLGVMENGGSYNPADKIPLKLNLYFDKVTCRNISCLDLKDKTLKFDEVVQRKGDFTPFNVGDKFNGAWHTYWLYIELYLPPSWATYQEVHLILNTNSEAMIFDTKGKALQGLTGDEGVAHRIWYPIKRVEDGRNEFNTSGMVAYYIEVACTNLFGTFNNGSMFQGINENIKFTLDECAIGAFDREMWNLYWSFDILRNMANEIKDPQSNAGDMAMVVANKICNVLDYSNRASITECNKLATEFFQKTNSSSQHQIYACGHCHIDMAWLWPFSETRRKGARSFCSQLELMNYYKDFKFTASTACLYSWVQEDYPELFERIKATQRFIPVGGTWVEFDGNVPSGESMARQFLMGQKFFKKHFGKYCTTFFLPDTFGYSSQLPQIAKKSGIDYFITQKLSWNYYDKFPHTTFMWKGLDGTEILTHFPPADTYCANSEVSEILMSHSNFKDKGRSNASVLLYGVGDGGGGPQPEHIEKLIRMKDVYGVPKVKFASTNEFFEAILPDVPNLMKWSGELFLELHNGSYTSQAANKKYNRLCELLLYKSEFYSALAYIAKKDKSIYPTAAYKEILPDMYLFQFHDVLPGTCIKNVYDVTDARYPVFVAKFNELITKSNQILSDTLLSKSKIKSVVIQDNVMIPLNIDPTNLNKIGYVSLPQQNGNLVLNSTPFLRTEIVQTSDGTKSLIYNIPAYGFISLSSQLLRIQQTIYKVGVSKVGNSIMLSNSFINVAFTNEGIITSITDTETEVNNNPATRKELIAPTSKFNGGNAIFLFEDLPIYWDAWDIWPFYMEKGVQIKASSYVLNEGVDESSIKFTYPISAKSTMTVIASLRSFSKRIDFSCNVDWHEEHKLLRVYFPVNIISDYASFDTQFGVQKRTTRKNTSWELAKYEVCANQYMDVSDGEYGAAILNNCKYGFSVDDSLMGMSLLKSPKAPNLVTDQGTQIFTYSFLPHMGSFEKSNVIKEARCLNNPVEVIDINSLAPGISSSQSDSFIKLSKSTVEIDCLKLSENSVENINTHELVLRMHECIGSETVVACDLQFATLLGYTGAIKATVTNILEDPITDDHVLISDNQKGSMMLRLKAFEAITLKLALNF